MPSSYFTEMEKKDLVICPVYNEEATLESFYGCLRSCYMDDVLFVDDGSTDRGKEFLENTKGGRTFVIRHPERSGYGAALNSGFSFSLERGYTRIITLDVDLQHDPARIPAFLDGLLRAEVVLGSRYMRIASSRRARPFPPESDSPPAEAEGLCSGFRPPHETNSAAALPGEPHRSLAVPRERLLINRYVAKLIQLLFSVEFSDPFCGYRAYRMTFLRRVRLEERGYGLALEILMEVIRLETVFTEIPVKVVYLDRLRQFLDGLDCPRRRLLYYLGIIARKKMEMESEEEVFSYQPSPR